MVLVTAVPLVNPPFSMMDISFTKDCRWTLHETWWLYVWTAVTARSHTNSRKCQTTSQWGGKCTRFGCATSTRAETRCISPIRSECSEAIEIPFLLFPLQLRGAVTCLRSCWRKTGRLSWSTVRAFLQAWPGALHVTWLYPTSSKMKAFLFTSATAACHSIRSKMLTFKTSLRARSSERWRVWPWSPPFRSV